MKTDRERMKKEPKERRKLTGQTQEHGQQKLDRST
jgi:hypothetical protein